jgi:hypothetical protein
MRKETIVALFKGLSWHLSKGTDKNHGKPQSQQPVVSRDLYLGCPKYEAGHLTT